jgi:hypothetical protein
MGVWVGVLVGPNLRASDLEDGLYQTEVGSTDFIETFASQNLGNVRFYVYLR